MQTEQFVAAQRHSKRIFIYKNLLFYTIILIGLAFITILALPYIKKLKLPSKNVAKSLLTRMQTTSLMLSPKIVSYKDGKKVYVIEATETSQDYNNNYLLHLKNIKAHFVVAKNETLFIISSHGDFSIKDKKLYLPDAIKLQFQQPSGITNMLLPNAFIDIKANKLTSKGKIELDNKDIKLLAHGLTASYNATNLLFTDKVLMHLKANNIIITANNLQVNRTKQQLLWYDKVELHKDDDILKADKLIATYNKSTQKTLYGALKAIKAYGHIYMQQNGDVALACEMSLDVKSNKINLHKCPATGQTTFFFSEKTIHKFK